MKRDLVLSAVSGYDWSKVELWALSLASCGFKGVGAVIVYDNNETVINNLKKFGFQVITVPLNGSVFNRRFFDFYNVTKSLENDFRYAVITDIRDVFFQSDPMLWLEQNLTGKFYACSEAIKYKDESWGRGNLMQGFPNLQDRIMNKTIYNVGVLAGEVSYISDLCLSIYNTAASTGFPVADQSGYNLLIDMHPYKDIVQLGMMEDGFAMQAGTVADPKKIQEFRPFLLEPEPILDQGVVKTSTGITYPIVHQYDRVPQWNLEMLKVLQEKIKKIKGE